MRLARRLFVTLVLLTLPAALAHGQVCGVPAGDAANEVPCRSITVQSDCTAGCDNGALFGTCSCYWDDPSNPLGFPMDNGVGLGSECSGAHPCCWNRPCASFIDAGACAQGGGGSQAVEPPVEDRCHWFPDEGRCGCRPPLVEAPFPSLICDVNGNPSLPDGTEIFAPFDCYLPIDHFTFYNVKTSKGADRFVRFGPVQLTDAFTSAPYQVTKPVRLGLPANENGAGVRDADTHSEEYLVKPVAGAPKFAKRSDVHVVNPCSDLLLEVTKPVSLLVPTAKSLTGPVAGPVPADGTFKHFLCYQAKPQAKLADGSKLPKFPKGIQVDVADQFQTRRYDLVKITKLCNPVDKAGTPTLLSGPNKGAPKPITNAVRWSPDERLVCYQARLATRMIAQSGCGPTTPGDTGTKIVPKQAKHSPRTGIYVGNQFGAERLDTVHEAEFCVPSQIAAP